MSHTKGPWEVGKPHKGQGSISVYREGDTQNNIANVFSGNRADLSLIAASPDMLNALELADRALCENDASLTNSAIHCIRNAIQKAVQS